MRRKASRLLAMLAVAGFCGTTQTQARSHRIELRQLQKQRAQHLEEHREVQERLGELDATPDRDAEEARLREVARSIAEIDKAIERTRSK